MSNSNQSFFDEIAEQSQVKAEIVAKYFWAWAKVIIPSAKKNSNRIAYIDLFAGPGRYKDGSKSTPVLILEQAVADSDMQNMLVSLFNDANEDNTRSLENSIKSIPGIDKLKYKPKVFNEEVGDKIVQMFEKNRFVPTLFFVDPWGYKGLSLRLVNSVLKDWGCDCIFFFNYNRINMGLNNPYVRDPMDALFGTQRADQLRLLLEGTPPTKRELVIIEAIAQSLKDMGGSYVLPFRFKNSDGSRTSHHLIFVSKHVRGYEIMKEIMAKESSDLRQGVPSFEYNPATSDQPLLFDLIRPLDDLADMLLTDFAGQSLSMIEVYDRHHVGRQFIKSNYKDALAKLEENGSIVVDPPASIRKKIKGKLTFADQVKVRFPQR
jgi:three-Cys-motif partner protein